MLEAFIENRRPLLRYNGEIFTFEPNSIEHLLKTILASISTHSLPRELLVLMSIINSHIEGYSACAIPPEKITPALCLLVSMQCHIKKPASSIRYFNNYSDMVNRAAENLSSPAIIVIAFDSQLAELHMAFYNRYRTQFLNSDVLITAYDTRKMLTPFTQLTRYLEKHFYSRKQDPSLGPAEEKSMSASERDFRILQRQRSWPDNSGINHNSVHHYRSMAYVPMVLLYLTAFGSESYRDLLDTENRTISKFALTMAYSSIERRSEIDFSTQPETHKRYRKNAGALFLKHYQQYQRALADNGVIPEHLNVFACFDSEANFLSFHRALIVMGSDTDIDPTHVVISICHKLDLYRCRVGQSATASISRYIRRFSDPKRAYGVCMQRLITFANDLILATGDRTHSRGRLHHDKHLNHQCQDFHFFIKTLSTLSYPVIHEDIIDTSRPCVIKSISKIVLHEDIRPKDYFPQATINVHRIIQSDGEKTVNNETFFPLRIEKAHSAFTWKIRNEESGAHSVQLNIKTYQPELSAMKKANAGYGKKESCQYVNGAYKFTPHPFWLYFFKTSQLPNSSPIMLNETVFVGIKSFMSHVKISRIYSQDAGTSSRRTTTQNRQEKPKALMESKEELILKENYFPHDILARINQFDGIVIFLDNLASRIIAILRAEYLRKHIIAMHHAAGLATNELTGVVPIEFYHANDNVHEQATFTLYRKKQQEYDLWFFKQHYPERHHMLQDHYDHSFFFKPGFFMEMHHRAARGDHTYFTNNPDININTQDHIGKTPLHYALQNGHIDLALRLLRSGATILKDNFTVYQLDEELQPKKIRVDHHHFFAATLRCGRHDIALEFLQKCQEENFTLPFLFDDALELNRFFLDKNSKVILELLKQNLIDPSLADDMAFNLLLFTYATTINNTELLSYVQFDLVDPIIYTTTIAQLAQGAHHLTLLYCVKNPPFDFDFTLIEPDIQATLLYTFVQHERLETFALSLQLREIKILKKAMKKAIEQKNWLALDKILQISKTHTTELEWQKHFRNHPHYHVDSLFVVELKSLPGHFGRMETKDMAQAVIFFARHQCHTLLSLLFKTQKSIRENILRHINTQAPDLFTTLKNLWRPKKTTAQALIKATVTKAKKTTNKPNSVPVMHFYHQ